MQIKPRLLLKISGGQLKNLETNSFFDGNLLKNLVEQVDELTKDYQVGIVLGGGNIWRGKDKHIDTLSNLNSDYLGMIATVMNGIVLKEMLEKQGIKTTLFSGLHFGKITKEVNPNEVNECLDKGHVLIFSGGTGLPFVTTDTAAVVRAIEINAEIVLFGKDGVKGVYDKDPKTNPDAVFFPKLTYQEVIEKRLKVIDCTAFALAQENNLKFLIFNQSIKNSFVDAVRGKIELTAITNE